jgi:transcriptional regulator NrdR family protein
MAAQPCCLKCGHSGSKVVDTRLRKGLIRRRRCCLKCDARWSTYEISERDLSALKLLLKKTSDDFKRLF